MARDTTHPLQPRSDHDTTSRQLSVLACKSAIRNCLQPALQARYADRAAGTDIRATTTYRIWSAANRVSQDQLWQIISDQVDADEARIRDVAARLTTAASGSLTLNPNLDCPAYQTKATIHGQTGGYMLERDAEDLAAGVLYEAGGNIYALGQGIGQRDSKGERLIALINERFPGLAPKRILEMGCSAGGQSTDYPPAFPDAQFHAIDLSAGMLRYAHARAEALGVPVNFHQLDAAKTSFDDASFDLIISHNMFHEVAAEYMPRVLAECYRLLRPGGVCLHQDVPIQTATLDPFTQFISEWQTSNNDEPFWMDFANADLPEMAIAAGFEPDLVSSEYIKALDGPIPWYVVTAVR